MINLSFNELRLIAQLRNISNYESKSKEDFIKALSESKPEAIKPETPKPEIKTKPHTTKSEKNSKPETPRTRKKTKQTKPEPELEPKIRVTTDKSKLKNLQKDFDELRYKFSKKNRQIQKSFLCC